MKNLVSLVLFTCIIGLFACKKNDPSPSGETDPNCVLVSQTYSSSGSTTPNGSTYSYNTNGQLSTWSYSDGTSSQFFYDSNGKLSYTTGSGNQKTTFEYNSDGSLSKMNFFTNNTLSGYNTFQTSGNVITQTYYRPNGTISSKSLSTLTGSNISSAQYISYNTSGNMDYISSVTHNGYDSKYNADYLFYKKIPGFPTQYSKNNPTSSTYSSVSYNSNGSVSNTNNYTKTYAYEYNNSNVATKVIETNVYSNPTSTSVYTTSYVYTGCN